MESEKSGFVNEMSKIWRKMQVKNVKMQVELVDLFQQTTMSETKAWPQLQLSFEAKRAKS